MRTSMTFTDILGKLVSILNSVYGITNFSFWILDK